MISYLGFFSTSFTIALIVWPFISLVLTLPILAIIYHRHHRLLWSAGLSSYGSVLYVLGLVAFTLYPMPDDPAAFCARVHLEPQWNPLRFIEDVQTSGLSGVLQLVMNMVLFIPLGFMLTRWMRWHLWTVAAAGLAVSGLIEVTQLTGFWRLYPCAYRQFDTVDLLTNTIGVLIGAGFAMIFAQLVPAEAVGEEGINRHPGLLHRAVTFAIDMTLITLTYVPLGIAVVLAFHVLAAPQTNGDFTILGHTVGVGITNVLVAVIMTMAFLVYELWIPLRHGGQTLGGMFTHMSVETRERTGFRRALFYTLRTFVLYCLVEVGFDVQPVYRFGLVAVLAVFWMFARTMPYDLVPGSSVPESRIDAS